MLDYETLRLIWWAILGVLLIGFVVTDGFDIGSAILLPFVAKSDGERRVVFNTFGPVWEGNQVWFVLAGGATFAAWPALYATSFSSFYLAMFLVLAALILRPVAIKYRSKVENAVWRQTWDWALFVSGIVPAFVFGVAFGNLFLGVPFDFDGDLRLQTSVTLFSLLSPFALLVGLVSVSMIVLHGAAWLNMKAEGKVRERAANLIPWMVLAFAVLFGAAGYLVEQMHGFQIAGEAARNAPSNPLLKQVVTAKGVWFENFKAMPVLWLAPAIAYLAGLLVIAARRRSFLCIVFSALVPASTIATAGFALFPFLLPSTSNPNASLTVWDASSSKLTLEIMLGAVVIFLPIVLAYTSWVYAVFRGRVSEQSVSADKASY